MIECDDSGCRIGGAITVENAASILVELMPRISENIPLLDFSGVAVVDSTVVALILSCKRASEQQNYQLRFSGFTPSVITLAELYGITPLLQA